MELLAEGGLAGLSTRRLGERCKLTNAGLYYYFQNKSELLDHVANAILRPAWRPIGPGERWQDWLHATTLAVRRQLLLYPDGALVAAGAWPRPELAGDAVALLYKPILDAGFAQEEARHVLLSVLRFAVGWTTDEQAAQSRGAARPVNDEGFAFGLKAMICGFEAALAGQPGSRVLQEP